ncbi:SDR family NAD(P)-dependent oxidoreductase [Flavihumibacter sp. UBA7668]|uniref:SDR family NAD(P)-dependent oxidoreductase n=1 Tax=Flavihumibacter sp. UBA7668 TaxID=1946542 RepID=UPI0025BC7060|nr:SDR family NAD(P)-dependent oxidoreductase [Flavihumibacter sp. UBA7668]
MEQEFNYANELSGKIALITGGTKGTGKAIAERLEKAGAIVLITARNQPEMQSAKMDFIQADLSLADGTRELAEEVLSKY